MIICLLAVNINISRWLKFACYLLLLTLIQSNLISVVHGAPGGVKVVHTSSNQTFIFEQVDNLTKTKILDCKADVINSTLPYFSLPYRIFAGALIVPITFCAIFGNILVIYVIKHYRNLRITGNVFLASLAVADVGVSTLAMTFYGLQLLQGRWLLGAVCK